jgi:hypothetical protein
LDLFIKCPTCFGPYGLETLIYSFLYSIHEQCNYVCTCINAIANIFLHPIIQTFSYTLYIQTFSYTLHIKTFSYTLYIHDFYNIIYKSNTNHVLPQVQLPPPGKNSRCAPGSPPNINCVSSLLAVCCLIQRPQSISENRILAQQVKKISSQLGNPNVQYSTHKSLPLDFDLHSNSVQVFTPYYFHLAPSSCTLRITRPVDYSGPPGLPVFPDS